MHVRVRLCLLLHEWCYLLTLCQCGSLDEGFMATGVASDATDAAVQANIVAVGYSGFSFPQE
jgi:hypothetical protein